MQDTKGRRALVYRPLATTCIMGTKEALERLTGNEKDKSDSEDEWIILKVPKKMKGKFFFAVFVMEIQKTNFNGWKDHT